MFIHGIFPKMVMVSNDNGSLSGNLQWNTLETRCSNTSHWCLMSFKILCSRRVHREMPVTHDPRTIYILISKRVISNFRLVSLLLVDRFFNQEQSRWESFTFCKIIIFCINYYIEIFNYILISFFSTYALNIQGGW